MEKMTNRILINSDITKKYFLELHPGKLLEGSLVTFTSTKGEGYRVGNVSFSAEWRFNKDIYITLHGFLVKFNDFVLEREENVNAIKDLFVASYVHSMTIHTNEDPFGFILSKKDGVGVEDQLAKISGMLGWNVKYMGIYLLPDAWGVKVLNHLGG